MNDRITSYQVVALLRKAGYHAWKPGTPGFKVWSSKGTLPRVSQYGFPPLSVQQQWLDTYATVLAAAGIVTVRRGHFLAVTERIAA